MRIAIVSDIHGNRTAFGAVLADLGLTSPDLILHGGDLPHGGSSPAEIVDRIRDLGWQGVLGNTDEMLFAPDSLEDFAARQAPELQSLFAAIREMAAWTRQALGEERIAWLSALPRLQVEHPVALVHASPETTWRAPVPEASDLELESVYAPLVRPVAVYGHIHRPYIRELPRLTVANSGSVGLPYDGDPRAAYLLLEGAKPEIRRVEYEVDAEIDALSRSGLPHATWVARMLARGGFETP
ncbi:MAG TPA: metallophosphoesterase family protein [Terriglobia bacterium]|nr:metallophosphoesterase family protein [Terriglobia bacterium]